MATEKDGILFADGGGSVLFHPPTPYADGHGFHHQVDIACGPFRGTITASSYAPLGAMAEFREQLLALHENLRGEASLPNAYENLRMSLVGDGLGHVTVRGEARADDSYIRLTFHFMMDQTQLPNIIRAVEQFFLN